MRDVHGIEQEKRHVKIEQTGNWVRRQGPGIILIGLLALVSELASTFIGETLMGFERSPVSSVMVALLIGLTIRNIRPLPKIFAGGVSFGTKGILRLGIILLGLRLSIVDMVQVIRVGLPVIVVCVVVGLLLPHVINRWMKLPVPLVTLISVGTSICGVSAIIATSESLQSEKEHTAYAIAVITLFGLAATLAYPLLAWSLFSGNTLAAGLFLGTAIHDTSQVAGAAFLYQDYFSDPFVVETAAVVKLLRNGLMVAVIPGISWYHLRVKRIHSTEYAGETHGRVSLPGFILWFVGMSLLRSAGDQLFIVQNLHWASFNADLWRAAIGISATASSVCITMALAAVGLGTSFSVFKGLGFKPFLLGLCTAMCIGAVGILMIFLVV